MKANINRRALIGAGTAAVAASVAATSVAIGRGHAEEVELSHESEKQIAAFLADLDKAIADRAAAIEAKDWKVAEYAHLWPLAPEEILGVAHAWEIRGRTEPECNLAGEPIYRRAADLTKRMSREYRTGEKGQRMLNFSVDTPDWCRERRDGARAKAAKTKSMKSREEWLRLAAARERGIVLSEEYYAETERLRKISGIAEILAAREEAKERMREVLWAMSGVRATTPLGAAMKAQAIKKWTDVEGIKAKEDNRQEYLNGVITGPWSQSIVDDLLTMSLG